MSKFIHAKVEIEETAATIAAEGRYFEPAIVAIKAARRDIERQIRRDPFFLTTLEPYDFKAPMDRVVQRMCEASALAQVGPMAAVAGAIAQEALEAMMSSGCTHGWVDNGGDVALVLESPVTMEIFSEPGARTASALELEPSESAFGVCTSSGKLGHSISFGNADAAVAVADSATLADAIATAMGNRVVDKTSLRTCFDPVKGIKGFRGGVAMLDGQVALHGRLPRMVEVKHREERVTVHSRMSAPEFTSANNQGSEVRS
jgi:ApbE superfamily uncharacterized protein (UPF0280 family)